MFDAEPGPRGFSSSNNELNASCTFTALMCLAFILKVYMQRFDTVILFVHALQTLGFNVASIDGNFTRNTGAPIKTPRYYLIMGTSRKSTLFRETLNPEL